MEQLGRLQARYGANLVKSLLNAIIAGGLMFSGGYVSAGSLSAGEVNPFSLLFLALFLIGLAVAIMLYRQITRSFQLHEHGVIVKGREGAGTYLYRDLEDVGVAVGRLSNRANPHAPKVKGAYSFFKEDKLAFTVTNDVIAWEQLGERLLHAVVEEKVAQFEAQLQRGESLSFDKLKVGYYISPQPVNLNITPAGVQAGQGALIPWEQISKVTIENDAQWNNLIGAVYTRAQGRTISFNMENSQNAHIVYQLLKRRVGSKVYV